MKMLLTGGAGYIGSHIAVQALSRNYDLAILDNFSNSSRETLDAISILSGKTPIIFECDMRNKLDLLEVFNAWRPELVIHLAGLKAVGESVAEPLRYYENNVLGTLNMLQAMEYYECKKLVFSSSATVYGSPQYIPIDERHPRSAINPYGQTKLDSENMLSHWVNACPSWAIMSLRYFNPVGAHPSGLIGDNPLGKPNNIIPYIARVAARELPYVEIFGDDYETEDGTGVRDYVHVEDLARSHLLAADWLTKSAGHEQMNIGTGCGTSVLELIKKFEVVNNVYIPFRIAARRSGDVASSYAKCDKAKKLIGFAASRVLEDMLASAWRWEQQRKKKTRN